MLTKQQLQRLRDLIEKGRQLPDVRWGRGEYLTVHEGHYYACALGYAHLGVNPYNLRFAYKQGGWPTAIALWKELQSHGVHNGEINDAYTLPENWKLPLSELQEERNSFAGDLTYVNDNIADTFDDVLRFIDDCIAAAPEGEHAAN
jgi:hypothetical protein